MRLTPSFVLVATLLVGCGGGPSTLTSPPGPAVGPASALIYPPGNFASTDELIAINSAAAPFGGVYITHMRSEADNFLEAIATRLHIKNRGLLKQGLFADVVVFDPETVGDNATYEALHRHARSLRKWGRRHPERAAYRRTARSAGACPGLDGMASLISDEK